MQHRSLSPWLSIAAAAALTLAAQTAAAQTTVAEARQVLPRLAVPRDADSSALQAPAASGVDASAPGSVNASTPAASMLPADHPMARSAFRAVPNSSFAGMSVHRMGVERFKFSRAQRGADGEFAAQCVSGEHAAHAATQGHEHPVRKEVRHAR